MTRNRIAGALAAGARLLMADEPTTDLDEEGQRLLRKELKAFAGSILLISHDRMLLRELCTRIWYLEDGKITDFPGGYDAFMAERLRQRERAAFEYNQYRNEQKRLKESEEKARRIRSEREADLFGLDGNQPDVTDFYEDEVFNVNNLPRANAYPRQARKDSEEI